MNERRPPNPYRPDPPIFPPVVFDDDDAELRPGRRRRREQVEQEPPIFSPPAGGEPPYGGDRWDWRGDFDDDYDDEQGDGGGRRRGRGRGPGPGDGYESDRGLLRILALLGVLGALVLALVVPGSPVRLIGRGGSTSGADGITASARDGMPALPGGFAALSKLYDLKVPAEAKGPWSIEISLTEQTTDPSNLGFYSWDGTRWTRVAGVALAPNGASVSGDVTAAVPSIAVLRRTAQAKTLGLIVQAGEVPDPAAIEATSVVAVMAASIGGDGALQATAGALKPVAPAAGKAKVFFGVSGGADGQAIAKSLGSAGAMTAQAEAIATAAKREGAAGVYLDAPGLAGGQKDAFSAFVKTVRDRLQRDQLGLVVGVPAAAGPNGAYDWAAILGQSDAIWLRGIPDPAVYYDQMEQALAQRKSGSLDVGRIALILDRRSTDRTAQQIGQVTLREALTAASAIDRKVESAAAPAGGTVALRALNLGDAPQGAGLRWDTTARAVAFSYSGAGGAHGVWIENRFSAAFRMDLAARHGLGGIVVDQARRDDALPDLWASALTYVQDGSIRLERPFGPYLAPCWQATQGTIDGVSGCWNADTGPVSVNWRAPQNSGTYPIRLVVSDGVTFVAQELALRVGNAAATPTPTPSGTPTPTPTARPGGTTTPPAPAATPRPAPTAAPTAAPTPAPTAAPTPAPSTSPPTLTPVQVPPGASTPPPTPAATPFPGGVPPGPAGQ